MSFPDAAARVEPLLVVADLSRSLAFWVDRLGGLVEVDVDSYARIRVGSGRVHLAVTGDPPPDRSVRLVPPSDDPATAHAEVVIQVTDCQRTCAELSSRGVSLLGPPTVPPWGGETRAFLRDPDGHLVEITSPHLPG
jgi:catechol 2,3-dioxygenase-like lactoylglutathione lyase family enzyme